MINDDVISRILRSPNPEQTLRIVLEEQVQIERDAILQYINDIYKEYQQLPRNEREKFLAVREIKRFIKSRSHEHNHTG